MRVFRNSSARTPNGLQFSDDARRLLKDARDEADRLRHQYVGTEHLVLALPRQSDGIAAATLAHLEIDLDQVRRTLTSKLVPGNGDIIRGVEHPYTSRTMTAFSLAAESARELGATRVGAEHLLIGLMREGRNIGARVLGHHGLTAEATIEEVRRRASDGGAQ